MNGGALGLARIVAVLVIAYGILRHQLLGIDLTVKRGIRRSTIAAIFIAVFFIVSEAAQVVFAGVVGSQILGIIAAGALVFALAPLQRFARSVADAAMPHAQDPDAMDDDERITVYRRQAEVAWADGALSADERALLDELRDQLGIDAEVVSEVESKVAQRGGGDV